jgi:hypothetical protein
MRRSHGLSILAVTVFTMAGDCRADGPDAAWITFLSHRSGGNRLYRMHPDGSGVTPIFGGPLKEMPGISDGMMLYREPHWTRQSPDRRYFLSWVADTIKPFNPDWDAPPFMIYLGRLIGGPARIVVPPGCAEDFAWAPDSTRFAFARSCELHYPMLDAPNRTHIVIAAIDGSPEDAVLDRRGAWAPLDWSPDGKKLLLWSRPGQATGTSRLFEFDLDRAARLRKATPRADRTDACLRPLTDASVVIADARYSPDGRVIAVVASKYLKTPSDEGFDMSGYRASIKLAVIKEDDPQLRAVIEYPEGLRGPICWSPNGREILFSRYLGPGDKREKMEVEGDPGLGIWAIHPDGKGGRFITTGWCPSWR